MSEVYPLFSKPVYVNKLSFDNKKFLSLIEDEFVESGGEKLLNQEQVSKASVDKDVLIAQIENKSVLNYAKSALASDSYRDITYFLLEDLFGSKADATL